MSGLNLEAYLKLFEVQIRDDDGHDGLSLQNCDYLSWFLKQESIREALEYYDEIPLGVFLQVFELTLAKWNREKLNEVELKRFAFYCVIAYFAYASLMESQDKSDEFASALMELDGLINQSATDLHNAKLTDDESTMIYAAVAKLLCADLGYMFDPEKIFLTHEDIEKKITKLQKEPPTEAARNFPVQCQRLLTPISAARAQMKKSANSFSLTQSAATTNSIMTSSVGITSNSLQSDEAMDSALTSSAEATPKANSIMAPKLSTTIPYEQSTSAILHKCNVILKNKDSYFGSSKKMQALKERLEIEKPKIRDTLSEIITEVNNHTSGVHYLKFFFKKHIGSQKNKYTFFDIFKNLNLNSPIELAIAQDRLDQWLKKHEAKVARSQKATRVA